MKQKALLVVSIVLTVFVLTILGGVVSTVQGAGKASPTATNTQAADLASPDPATLDANIQQTIQAREAAYQDLISQANARLQQMQAEQEALQAQIEALQSQSSIAPTSPAQVSPQQAAQIAAQYMGHSDLYSVETTSSNGATVYKVTFSSGNVVLVSLDGQVISVQAAPKASSSSQSRSSSSGGEHENHDQEHEGHDD